MRAMIALGLVLSLLAACATEIMQGYVGQPVEMVQLDYGPPSNIIEMPDGTRAYQWNINSSGVMPMTNYNSGTVYGGGTTANYYGTTTTYVPYESNCLYTLFASKQGRSWVVTGFREPNLMCL